jgi:hypothetical protein
MAVLIDRPPQIMPFALDGEKDLIKMPFVTGLRTPMAELMVRGRPSSAAMRRMRFFMVVGLVPSGSVRQVAGGGWRFQSAVVSVYLGSQAFLCHPSLERSS